jgi:hypothetical protein
MTIFEFAIARAYRQMLDLQKERILKKEERESLERLYYATKRYELEEMFQERK